MNTKTYIILVAGGKGLRMESEMPKQFHLVDGRPLVMHTFDAFSAFYGKAEFLLVLPELEIGSGNISVWIMIFQLLTRLWKVAPPVTIQ